MMRYTLIFLLTLWPWSLFAQDVITKAEEQTKVLAAQKSILLLRKELIDLDLKIANVEKSIAAARLKTAQDLTSAEAAERLRKIPSIIINAGQIYQISETIRRCDATAFLRYTCHRTADCPSFDVDEKICGVPAVNNQPMLLEVNYSCGTQQRTNVFPYGSKAYITCK